MDPSPLNQEVSLTALRSRPPLVIIGSPRSGTTVLTRMLNRFLDVHVARDAGLFLRYAEMLPSFGDLTQSDNMRRLIEALYQDYLFRRRFLERGLTLTADALQARLDAPTFSTLVREVFVATAASHGKSRWGNKKPSYSLDVGPVDALFRDARYVHIIRDGRDVVLSMRNAAHLLVEKNWYFAARDWQNHVVGGREMARRLGSGRCIEITYETLLSEPLETLRAILALLDAPPEEVDSLNQRAAEVQTYLRADNFNKWKTQMPPTGIRIVEQTAGSLLRDLDYELTFPEVVGRPFSGLDLLRFQVDRLIRNNVSRNARNVNKLLRYRLNDVLTSTRASRAKRLSRSSSDPAAER